MHLNVLQTRKNSHNGDGKEGLAGQRFQFVTETGCRSFQTRIIAHCLSDVKMRKLRELWVRKRDIVGETWTADAGALLVCGHAPLDVWM